MSRIRDLETVISPTKPPDFARDAARFSLRELVRRAIGVAITLLGLSIVALWSIATLTRRSPEQASRPFAALPLFFNASPQSVRELSAQAQRAVARGDAQAQAGSRTLARLGGAALPYVLPALDSLGPDERKRVALALAPIATRMGVGSPSELADGDLALEFWTRFWRDRALDFRTQVTHRLTARLAERSISTRREDLIELDTFPLPELIDALGKVETNDDLERVRRLSSVLSHVTELPYALAADADLNAARANVERWQDFWDAHGADYVAFDGPKRITTLVTETRYGKWLQSARRHGLGRSVRGESALSLVKRGLSVTSLLMLLGMLGGFGFGVLWARAERRAALVPRYASALAGTTLAALPVATVVLFTSSASSLPLAAAIVVVTTAAWVSRHLARATLLGADRHWAHALHAAAPLGAVHPPFVLTSVVLLEIGMRLPGLGRAAVDAIGNDDVNVWMACSLALALVTLVLRNLADLILARSAATESEP
ncbi:MAG TPA: hypothetical protein VGI10_18940 [Polyangiaceae bacterium]